MIAWDAGCFFTFPEGTGLDDVSIDFFSDLFGYEGLVLSYLTQESILDYQRSIIHDYYYFQDPDTPVLLARVYGGDTDVYKRQDEVREFQQLGGGAFEIREQVRITDDLVKRRPLALRQDRHLVHGGSADTPGWVVDDPPQPQVI